uniref:Myb/SANT-like domain-containing protein n=1 Tax=Ananas comosus var. bracteatus TaxID=296719 RepID=A0A6V7NWQ8_ANACO|nr:unnamed protein product [Ananas comosus var. bracteatus]
MRPFKKVSKSKHKQGGLADDSPNEASGGIRNDTRTRSQNWSNILDVQLLGLMRDEHTFGNCVNGSFTPIAWKRMVNDFNSRNNLNLTKQQLKNRFKVLKKIFNLYHSLANKSGWGWNNDLHIPTPGDARIWNSVIAENPAYARCRDKPFPPTMTLIFLPKILLRQEDMHLQLLWTLPLQLKAPLGHPLVELSSRADMPSQNQCMQRVYGMTGLTDDHILAVADAFKEDKNCNAFTSLNDKHAKKWVERQLAQQNVIYRQLFLGL